MPGARRAFRPGVRLGASHEYTGLTMRGERRRLPATGAPVDLAVPLQAGGDFRSMTQRTPLLLLSLLLAACGSARGASAQLGATPAPGPASSAPLRPSATATAPRPTPTPQPAARPACLRQPGRIEHGEVEHADLLRPLPFRIYLPACAGKPGFDRLPAIYLMHGLTYDDSQWDRLGAPAVADEMIANGDAPPFLLVLPWERTGLDMELAVTQVLVPYIEATYPAEPGRQNRAIGGLSRGGGWALRIGMQQPRMFESIGLHSPAVLSPDKHYLPKWSEALPADAIPRLALDIGQRDPLRPDALALAQQLDDLGLTVDVTLNPGEHTEAYWAEHVRPYLEWYVAPWLAAGAAE